MKSEWRSWKESHGKGTHGIMECHTNIMECHGNIMEIGIMEIGIMEIGMWNHGGYKNIESRNHHDHIMESRSNMKASLGNMWWKTPKPGGASWKESHGKGTHGIMECHGNIMDIRNMEIGIMEIGMWNHGGHLLSCNLGLGSMDHIMEWKTSCISTSGEIFISAIGVNHDESWSW